jgi:hypothetical protein
MSKNITKAVREEVQRFADTYKDRVEYAACELAASTEKIDALLDVVEKMNPMVAHIYVGEVMSSLRDGCLRALREAGALPHQEPRLGRRRLRHDVHPDLEKALWRISHVVYDGEARARWGPGDIWKDVADLRSTFRACLQQPIVTDHVLSNDNSTIYYREFKHAIERPEVRCPYIPSRVDVMLPLDLELLRKFIQESYEEVVAQGFAAKSVEAQLWYVDQLIAAQEKEAA